MKYFLIVLAVIILILVLNYIIYQRSIITTAVEIGIRLFTPFKRRTFEQSVARKNKLISKGYKPPKLKCSVEQLTYAVSYMMLEAEDNGVQSCIIGAMANEFTKLNPEISTKVKQKLGLNDNEIITTMITLGYEAESKPTPKLRKNFDDIIFLEKVGNKFD